MNAHHQTEKWLFYGACDLYFSFHSEELVFDYHSAFFAIMALEKHLKGCLIYSKSNEFEGLTEKESFLRAVDIAKSYGHDFPRMATEVEKFLPGGAFSKVLDRSHDTYLGRELIKVLRDSYMETRYPTKDHVSMSFPVGEKNIYYNPLSSSGFHHFIQASCNAIVEGIDEGINVNKLLRNVKDQYKHLEPFGRFQNMYAKGKWS